MSDSIYNILNWEDQDRTYQFHDIVYYSGQYYYCIVPHTSDTLSPFDTTKWGGTITNNGEVKPHFIWKSSNNSDNPFEPRVRVLKFGDGYEQRAQDGINNNLLMFNFNFDNRNTDEATAILHFLNQRSGQESFVFTPPKPLNASKRFVCRTWNNRFIFKGNYSISAKFEEVPI